MEIEKSKVLIKFLLNFRQSGDVLFFLNVRRLRGYTATPTGFLRPVFHPILTAPVLPILRLLMKQRSLNQKTLHLLFLGEKFRLLYL